MKRVLITLTLALAIPASAHAGNVTMVWREVPLGQRSLEAAAAPMRFDMLGLHWQGSGSVSYRTRSAAGGWSPWRVADADLPQTNPPWHFGNLDWTGSAVAAQYRVRGVISRLRAYYLSSRTVRNPARTLSLAGSPAIVPRTDWEADEKIVRAHPLYAPALKLAVVHHTAGTNDYTPAQSAAIVRGIEVYHVKGNGWNDIGYNFLVDRYGTVYEGRGGGITRNVIGAHALGFNTGTVGISLIGNFNVERPPQAMQDALVKLLAWRLDVAHLDPLSTVAYTSGGNGKFRAGKVVTLRAISGHRDTGPSECPGRFAYALLPSFAKQAAATGLPKLYAPVVSGALGGDVRFQARLSSALPWTVTVTDRAGKTVARHGGTSAIVDWKWSSAAAGKGPFAWAIASGNRVLAATGTLGGSLPAAPQPAPPPSPAPESLIAGLTASPSVLTLNADGTGLVVGIDFALAQPAQLDVRVGPLQLLKTPAPAGNDHFQWDLSQLPDGRYKLLVSATANGRTVTQGTDVVVDRTLSGLTATPTAFSPNADGSADTISFGFALSQSVPVQVVVQRAGVVVATLFAGQLGPGFQAIGWDGASGGTRVPDGQYTAVVTAADPLATVSLLVPFAIDTVAPVVTALNAAALQFQLSEPATMAGTINGQPVSAPEPVGAFTFPWVGPPVTSWSLQAKDAAGNAAAPVNFP